MKPISNYVVLKIRVKNDIVTFGDLTLWLDTTYSNSHTSVNCEVVAVPNKLKFSQDLPPDVSMPHKTDMELQVGDEVIVRYISVINALDPENPMNTTVDGEVHILVPYQDIVVAKRKWTKTEVDMFEKVNINYTIEQLEQENVIKTKQGYFTVIPLNGIILCEPIPQEFKTKLIIPDYLKKAAQKDIVKVRFVGKPNQEYWGNVWVGDDPCLKNGMFVIVDKDTDIPLESSEHLSFYDDQRFWRIEWKLIHGIYEKTA